MEWVKDNALQRHQEIYRMNLGLISLMVDRNEAGQYFYEIQGTTRRKSKETYATAKEAQDVAVKSARHLIGVMAAKLNSIEV